MATKRQIFRIVKKVFGGKLKDIKNLEEKELERMFALIIRDQEIANDEYVKFKS